MAAKFNYTCKNCGNNTFIATGYANDMAMIFPEESEDTCKFYLVLTCDKCSTDVAEVTQTTKTTSLTMDLLS